MKEESHRGGGTIRICDKKEATEELLRHLVGFGAGNQKKNECRIK